MSAAAAPTAAGSSALLTGSEMALVTAAFLSFLDEGNNAADGGLVPLRDLIERFNVSEHPRVKAGTMAPSAARDTLTYQFGQCAADHDGRVTFDEFVRYHEKLVDEAYDEQGVMDIDAFIARTIMSLWRLGKDLLLPTGIRPCFPVAQKPVGMYNSALMSLIWPERDPDNGQKIILKGIADVVRPSFRRDDLPEEVRGYFAYPEELTGMAVRFVSPQISVQRWLDFVWSYDEGKYCGVPGIISARVDRDVLPEVLRHFIVEHDHAEKVLKCIFVKTSLGANPAYKRTSDSYGYGVERECKRIHAWRTRSLAGKAYGLQYHGLQGAFFSKMSGPTPTNAATGMNM